MLGQARFVRQSLARDLWLDHRCDIRDDLLYHDRLDPVLELPALEPRKVQQIRYQSKQVELSALYALKRLSLRAVDRTVDFHREKIYVSADCIERSAELMTHRRQEFSLRHVRTFCIGARSFLGLE